MSLISSLYRVHCQNLLFLIKSEIRYISVFSSFIFSVTLCKVRNSFILFHVLCVLHLCGINFLSNTGIHKIFCAFRLDKWMLDMTEGPCRMRKKLSRNDLFYLHYPYRPELDSGDNKALKYKVASSWDSKEFYQKYRPQNLLERERDFVFEAQLEPEDPSDKVRRMSVG